MDHMVRYGIHMVHPSKRIAEIVTAERRKQDKSEHWLADEAGIARATLRRSLQGSRNFVVEEVAALAEALGLDARDLLDSSVVQPVSA